MSCFLSVNKRIEKKMHRQQQQHQMGNYYCQHTTTFTFTEHHFSLPAITTTIHLTHHINITQSNAASSTSEPPPLPLS